MSAIFHPENLIRNHSYRFDVDSGCDVQKIDGKFVEITVKSSLLGVLVKDRRTSDKSAPPIFIAWRSVVAYNIL